MLEGFSMIGTRMGVIISGMLSNGSNKTVVWCFNGEKVFHLPNPKQKHIKHGSVMLDDKLYLIGGVRSRSVERLDIVKDEWEEM